MGEVEEAEQVERVEVGEAEAGEAAEKTEVAAAEVEITGARQWRRSACGLPCRIAGGGGGVRGCLGIG